jgi:hypothetical protein
MTKYSLTFMSYTAPLGMVRGAAVRNLHIVYKPNNPRSFIDKADT